MYRRPLSRRLRSLSRRPRSLSRPFSTVARERQRESVVALNSSAVVCVCVAVSSRVVLTRCRSHAIDFVHNYQSSNASTDGRVAKWHRVTFRFLPQGEDCGFESRRGRIFLHRFSISSANNFESFLAWLAGLVIDINLVICRHYSIFHVATPTRSG